MLNYSVNSDGRLARIKTRIWQHGRQQTRWITEARSNEQRVASCNSHVLSQDCQLHSEFDARCVSILFFLCAPFNSRLLLIVVATGLDFVLGNFEFQLVFTFSIARFFAPRLYATRRRTPDAAFVHRAF